LVISKGALDIEITSGDGMVVVVLSWPLQPTAGMPAEVITITGPRQHNLRNLARKIADMYV
jgi:hypothetical protein